MASEVDICNTALSHIGHSGNVSAISPPDGSIEAEHCARFYPIARNAMQEAHAWSFNTRRKSLTRLADNPQEALWAYAYALPNGCLRPLRVLLPGSTQDFDAQDFEVETLDDGSKVLYTNVEDATLVYLVQVSDTTKFTAGFTLTLGLLLAYFLAGVIPKDVKLQAEIYKRYLAAGGPAIDAMGQDANARKNTGYGKNHLPAHLKARQ